MVKVILFAAILLELACCARAYARENRNPTYLKAPMVQWNENRLTGTLKNVPASDLLKNLIKSKHFNCSVKGLLRGAISISFDNLTIEEIIRKIMRNNNYNYTMLSTPDSADNDGHPGIGELTIYQGDSTVRFTRVPLQADNPSTETASGLHRSRPAKKVPNGQAAVSDGRYEGELKKLDQEIKTFLDELLASKRISIAEHEQAVADVKAYPQ